MRQELDELLCKRYPKIFRDRRASMQVTAMCWGFSCGDGWFNIIDAACSKIQSYIDQSRHLRAGALRYNRALKRALSGDLAGLEHFYTLPGREVNDWTKRNVLEDVKRRVYRAVPDALQQVVAVQVKEKFGGLRFYTHGGYDSYIEGVLSMAEGMSYRTCEVCGKPGMVRTDGWYATLCDEHAAAAGYNTEGDDDANLEN